MRAEFLAHQINAGGDVAPLIAAADLQLALSCLAEVKKIEGLEQHVAEFGVADSGFAIFHSGPDAFLSDHHVHGKMFSDLP